MNKICFIGEREAVGFWRGFGIDVFDAPAGDAVSAEKSIRLAVDKKYDLIYITRVAAVPVLDFIEKINFNSDSIITVIPGVGSASDDLSLKKLRRLSIKAIGSPPPE